MRDSIFSLAEFNYELLDQCLHIVLRVVSYKKYGKIDHLVFEVNSRRKITEIIETPSMKRVFPLDFGFRVVIAMKAVLAGKILLGKKQPESLTIMYNLVMANKFEEYFAYERMIDYGLF